MASRARLACPPPPRLTPSLSLLPLRAALLVLATLSLAAGCATGSAAGSGGPTPTEEVTLDPMLIRPGVDGPSQALDAGEVFQRAYTSFSARRFEEAAADYELIIRYFPDSRFLLPSLYNAGLAYEKLERWEDAARNYQLIIERFPDHEDTTDAYYRLAQAREQLEQWPEVVELMTQVLLRDGLSNFDRVESHVRRANALAKMGHYEEAADGYRTVLEINEKASPDERIAENSHFIVQTYFGLGEVYHQQVLQIPLRLPPERMGEDLQEKADLFMTAQANYIRALGFHHPQWSMAAGYMIGRLYEDFYTDIFSAELPEGLTDDQLALYFEELRTHIRPLMERAVQVYEKNLSLSERIGASARDNEWVASSTRNLQRLEAYLNDPATQRRAERFVAKGLPFEAMWDPILVARDAVDVARRQALQRIMPAEPEEPADPASEPTADAGPRPES